MLSKIKNHIYIKRNRARLVKLNNRESGKTAIIVGAGPSLNVHYHKLSGIPNSFTIGLNYTAAKLPIDYFIASYELIHVVMQRLSKYHHNVTPTQLFSYNYHKSYMQRYPKGVKGIYTIPYRSPKTSLSISMVPTELSANDPYLITKKNQAFLATGLAHILGCARIIYVGVEQNNMAHFYHYCENSRKRILHQLEKIKASNRDLYTSHSYATVDNSIVQIKTDRETAENTPFYNSSHEILMTELFEVLHSRGIELETLDKESIAKRAGANYLTLGQS
jgi:hypothetical protein